MQYSELMIMIFFFSFCLIKLVPSLTIVTNDEVSDEILQTADVSREIPSGLPRV